MTVFGFGRSDMEKTMAEAPARFHFGFAGCDGTVACADTVCRLFENEEVMVRT